MEAETELGMAQCHRNHINKNIEKLIQMTNYNDLVSASVQRGLITQDMRSIIEKRDSENHNMTEAEDLHNRHRKYFQKITNRGPQAYNDLKDILISLNRNEALRILENVNELPSIRDSEMFVSLRSQNRLINSHLSAGRFNSNYNVNSYNSASSLESGSSYNNSNNALKSPDSVDTPAFPSGTIHMNPDDPLVPYSGIIVSRGRKVIKSDCFHTHDVVGQYWMRSKTDRGVVLIVNIIDFPSSDKRNGGEVDSESLIHIFHEFGFKIFTYMNLNQKKFFKVLTNLIASKYVEDTECFVLVLMTHGERVGEIDKVQFHDGSFCDVTQITNLFQSRNASNLINKPKVMIYPFCRGSIADNGHHYEQKDYVPRRIETDSVGTQPNLTKNVSTLSDMLVCYATTAGFKTMRDSKLGSWYIQNLCDVMAEHAHNMAMEDILKTTDNLVRKLRTKEGNLQTGNFLNLGFAKKLFFNPGFPRE